MPSKEVAKANTNGKRVVLALDRYIAERIQYAANHIDTAKLQKAEEELAWEVDKALMS